MSNCLACGAPTDPASGRCPACHGELVAALLDGPTHAGQTGLLTALDGALVAWVCWEELPYNLRLLWSQRAEVVDPRRLEDYIRHQASPVALACAARHPGVSGALQEEALRRLQSARLDPDLLADLRRHFRRLLRRSRPRLLRHLSVPRQRGRALDRLDLLAEVVAAREVQGDLRAERPLARAFRAMFHTHRPGALWAVVGLCTGLFAVQESLLPGQRWTLMSWAALGPGLDRPWTLLTHALLHLSWLHLGLNMLSLVLVGLIVERILGAGRFLLFFALSGVGGGAASLLWKTLSHSGVPTVGASGAISGVAGIALYLGLWFERRYGQIPVRYVGTTLVGSLILVSQIFFGAVRGDPSVDHAAHLGGLLVGLVLGALVRPSLQRRADRQVAHRAAPSLAGAGR